MKASITARRDLAWWLGVFSLVAVCLRTTAAGSASFAIGENDFLLDGKPFLIRCGEMHFSRIPPEYWQHRLRMARALGLNTVCAYLFWNIHEPREGQFEFSGWADAAKFCRLAQAEGLKIILRPGPYSCAEWDFGGFPSWLLKTPDIKVRTRDPRYLAACQRYLQAVGQHLAPLQVTRGGPIIMVQVENEYGSYGGDKDYIGVLRDDLKAAGFEVPLFTCDGPSQLKNDTRDDLFCVVNFGSGPEEYFKSLRAVRPTGPLMCGEYYPGWFDSWGKPHHLGAPERIVKELGWMLEHNASFSIYMVHGGTSFGFTAGANSPPFSPQSTSYDYDAPISEAGWATPKFHALRALFLKHLSPGETLPDVPARNPVVTIPEIQFTEAAALFANLPAAQPSVRPQCMENYDQPHGCILYRTKLPAGPAGRLVIKELHDYGLIFVDRQKLATLDRRRNQNSLALPARPRAVTLDLLVEAFGHVNYGRDIHDRKGVTEKVELIAGTDHQELMNWEVYTLPLNSEDVTNLKFSSGQGGAPAFHRASFELAKPGDTFLDLSTWGKGVVWVNGHNLGRFWSLGPPQTLYCPAPWLKVGRNEIVVLELNGATRLVIAGLAEPILNRANDTGAPKKHRDPGQHLTLKGIEPAATGEFAPGKDWQEIKFAATTARYFCLEALDSHPADEYTTCAEICLLDARGQELARESWKVVYADSEETAGDDGIADNVFDLQATTIWHSQWESAKPKHPHQIVIDLGREEIVAGLRYLPRQDSANGRIKNYRLFLNTKPLPGLATNGE